jgi:hypothetical protein
MKYPFININMPTKIHNAKNILSQIAPNAIFAYCVKKSNTGDHFAR